MSDLDLVLTAITKTLSPKRVILFGSRARGDSSEESDIDLAVIQEKDPQLGQRAKVFRELINMGYTWKVEPDIHMFSEKNFEERLKNNSFFIREVVKGRTVYAI